MTTNYNINDVLPKDSDNNKFIAGIDMGVSGSNQFALFGMVGASPVNAQNVGHLAIGTHVSGSPIRETSPMVVLAGRITADDPSTYISLAGGYGDAKPLRINQEGELAAREAPIQDYVLFHNGSAGTVLTGGAKAASGILIGYNLSSEGGGVVEMYLKNDNATVTHCYMDSAGTKNVFFPGGVLFDTNIGISLINRAGTTGTCATIFYR